MVSLYVGMSLHLGAILPVFTGCVCFGCMVLDGITQVTQHIIGMLAVQNLELETAVSLLIYHQLIRFGQDAMFAALHAAQHLLVRANAEKAYVQIVRFHRQVEGRFAGFGRINIVAVAGDAAQLHLLEWLIQVV